MIYRVYNESSVLYEGDEFKEAFLTWSNSKGKAKINVPITSFPKLLSGDDFYDDKNIRYVIDDYEVKVSKSGTEIVYHAFDEQGRKMKFLSSEISKYAGGGIVNDYQRIKEGLIFKNEYLARLVEKYVGQTPEMWYERVGAMIYTTNKKYLDALEDQVRQILTKIENHTDYISKMINEKPIQKFNFDVEYESGNELITIMAFSKSEAQKVALKKAFEKTKITGKKVKKITDISTEKLNK